MEKYLKSAWLWIIGGAILTQVRPIQSIGSAILLVGIGMFIYNKKKKPSPVSFVNKHATSDVEVIYQYNFTQSNTFRGHRKIRLTTFGYKPIADNFDSLKIPNPMFDISSTNRMGKTEESLAGVKIYEYIFDLSGKNIDILECKKGDDKFLQVMINGKHIGTIFESNSYYEHLLELLHTNMIEFAHVRIGGGFFKILDNVGSGNFEFFESDMDNFYSDLFIKVKENK